jgi:phosphoglycolate phosphatase
MPHRAILFDLDGTLLNTLEDIGNAVNRTLSAQGFPTHVIDAYRFFVGDGEVRLVTRALPEDRRDDETIRSCLEAYRADYNRNWDVKTKPYDGVAEMLDALTARGLKRAVLSNKPHELTQRCVTTLLPNWGFDVILGQRDGVPLKPDPTAALEVVHTLDIPPADFLCLGDTAVDIQMAITAGMLPVGVLWGFRTEEELRTSGAEVLIERPLEILEILTDSGLMIGWH